MVVVVGSLSPKRNEMKRQGKGVQTKHFLSKVRRKRPFTNNKIMLMVVFD